MPGVHDVQHRLNQWLTGPGTLIVLLFGAYLASKGHAWGEPWVAVGLVIILLIGGLGGAVVVPASRRMAELSRADVEPTPGGREVTWGAAYDRLYRRYMTAEIVLGLSALTAILFMAAKPFA
jgi:hypothetical protein